MRKPSGEQKVLNESQVSRIVSTIPETRDRAAMMVHLSVMGAWSGEGKPSDEAERLRIVDWINTKWPTDTVRAKMARKVAEEIRLLKHREG